MANIISSTYFFLCACLPDLRLLSSFSGDGGGVTLDSSFSDSLVTIGFGFLRLEARLLRLFDFRSLLLEDFEDFAGCSD